MKYISICLWLILSLTCCTPDEEIAGEGGPMGWYYLQNNTTIDLYAFRSNPSSINEDTLHVAPDSFRLLYNLAAFLTSAQPSENLDYFVLHRSDSTGLVVAYEQFPVEDSLWKKLNFDTIPELKGEHYSITVVDSMLN